MTTLTQSELDAMRRKAEQPFEKYAALAASIGVLATHAGGISLIEWGNHLAQINAVIAQLTAERDEKAAENARLSSINEKLVYDFNTLLVNGSLELDKRQARIAELEAQPSAQFVAGMREALLRLANAADDVGVQYFDTDSASAEVSALQEATIAARAILAEAAALEQKEQG